MQLYSVVVILFELAIILNAQRYEPDYVRPGLMQRPDPFEAMISPRQKLYREKQKMPGRLRNLNLFNFDEVEEVEYSLIDCIHEHIGKCPHIVIGVDQKCPEYYWDLSGLPNSWNNFQELKHLVEPGTVRIFRTFLRNCDLINAQNVTET